MKEKTRYQKWLDEIVVKSFRSSKSMISYMDDRPDEEWRKMESYEIPWDLKNLLDTTGAVDWSDRPLYINKLGHFIDSDSDFTKLYGITIENFIEFYHYPDSPRYPVIGNFLSVYSQRDSGIEDLINDSKGYFSIEDFSTSEIAEKLNLWVEEENRNSVKPEFYKADVYSYFLVVLGLLVIGQIENRKSFSISLNKVDIYYHIGIKGAGHEIDLVEYLRGRPYIYGHVKNDSVSKLAREISRALMK